MSRIETPTIVAKKVFSKNEIYACLAIRKKVFVEGQKVPLYEDLDLNDNPAVLTAKLSAQTYAIPFYEKFGFIVCSEEYMDAGIPHKDMQLFLDRNGK